MTGKQRSTFQVLTGVISVSTIVLLGACGTQTKQVAQAPAADATASAPGPIALTPPNPNNLPVPGVPILQNSQLPTIPIQGLTPATEPTNLAAKAQSRPSQVDPFTSTGPTFFSIPFAKPTTPAASKTADAKATQLKAANSKTLGTIAKTQNRPTNRIALNSQPRAFGPSPRFNRPAAALPSFPQLRQPQAMSPIAVPQLPAIAAPRVAAVPQNVPPAIAPIRPSLAEGIAISGVLQTNGKTMVIAKSPNEPSARYVQAGDAIGSVRVKSIQVSRSGEPTVVLEQNGVEVTKSIGQNR